MKCRAWSEEATVRADNSKLGAVTRGVGYRLRKSMDMDAKDPSTDNALVWDSDVQGVIEGNEWVRVGNRYLPIRVNGVVVLVKVDPKVVAGT